MAMLAEGRRKQKISTDPRGNAWRKDENKFGQKLMEKMGWSEGKGLGANEDGDVNHVSIYLKADKKGVGCSKSHADDWIAHQDDFSALLEQLNESHGGKKSDTPEGPVQKMEEKSKTAKGRVHYQKFTKGKDLSRKSATDLDCVFGKRKTPTSGTNTPDVQASSDESDEATGLSHGVKTIRSTDSIQDYFARKMAERKNKLEGKVDSSETVNPESVQVDSVDCVETKKKKKKKDKKKRKEMDNLEIEKEATVNGDCQEKVSFALGGEDSDVDDKALKEAERTEGNENCVEESSNTRSKKSKKSKKNKRRHDDAFENKNSVCDNETAESHEATESSTKKARKSKKQKKRDKEIE